MRAGFSFFLGPAQNLDWVSEGKRKCERGLLDRGWSASFSVFMALSHHCFLFLLYHCSLLSITVFFFSYHRHSSPSLFSLPPLSWPILFTCRVPPSAVPRDLRKRRPAAAHRDSGFRVCGFRVWGLGYRVRGRRLKGGDCPSPDSCFCPIPVLSCSPS